jgi:tetratricopeptide (TPR) repeat protein
MTPIGSTPAASRALLQEGLELHRSGRLEEARARYATIAQKNPRDFDALHLLGTVLYQLGRPGEAVTALERALAIDPRAAFVHNLLGSVRESLGRPDAALAAFDAAIALQPRMVEARYNRAGLLQRGGRPGDALAGYDAAIALAPGMAQAHHNRGVVLELLARPADALASYERAVAANPALAGSWYNRGLLLARERPSEALASFDRVLRLDPAFPGAVFGRAMALQHLGLHAEALAALDQVIAADPQDAEALHGRALMLHRLDRDAEALDAADRAIALQPGDAEAHQLRALVLHDLNRLDEAIASFDRAIALSPDDLEMRYRRSFSLLSSGRWAQGWRDYEHRWAKWNGRPKTVDEARRWTGAQDPRGKTVFVFYEQGLGDTILFSRYVPALRARGARVLLAPQNSLAALLAPLCDEGALLPEGVAPPEYDLQCALLDLPAAMGTTPGAIPTQPPYLAAPEDRTARFAALLGPAGRPRVGLAWSGNPTHPNDRRRSIAFERLSPLLIPDVEWVCLQTDLRPADAEAFRRSGVVRWLGDQIADFADTAGLIELMDVVVSVDTSVAHLAGAMGKPVCVMLPFAADWRWMAGRDDSPWYPSARLIRQRQPGDWESVLENVARRVSGCHEASR